MCVCDYGMSACCWGGRGFFFFFKQKTAYEMRISDWSSDVCSSDLVPGLRIIGTAPHKAAILSFVMDGAHPQDIGSVLDMEGVAIRTGHHCTMPLMERFHVPATARASLAIYNGEDDIDQLVTALMKVHKLFA